MERILGFGARGEMMNGVGLSTVSPAGPQAFTCALHCWVLCRTLRNARMALEGVGEDLPQQMFGMFIHRLSPLLST